MDSYKKRIRLSHQATSGGHNCDQCNRVFPTGHSLRNHKRIHNTNTDVEAIQETPVESVQEQLPLVLSPTEEGISKFIQH